MRPPPADNNTQIIGSVIKIRNRSLTLDPDGSDRTDRRAKGFKHQRLLTVHKSNLNLRVTRVKSNKCPPANIFHSMPHLLSASRVI